MAPWPLALVDHRFAPADWAIIAVYLLATTLLGARLAGKQTTIRDFFLGGRRLPWWAVCGSIIATEISAATFVAVPTISFLEGGNLTYLQLAIGAVLARVIIGCWFVPRFFEREIYSPYDYMERQLGIRVKKITTGLFFVGAVLGQGARVYITAFVLSIITGLDLVSSIWVMGAFSVGWTLLGGITTVIWTDVMQFAVLLLGACVTLWYAVTSTAGSLSGVVQTATDAGKLTWYNGSADLSLPYTIWCGLLATPFLNLAAFGTDQVMAQRMFCCRNQGDARKAIIVSSVSVVVALLMLCVGIGLYCYFIHHPFTPQETALMQSKSMRSYLLPIFIVRALPVGVRGLIVAAVFASAVSTLDSTLAALSQTTLSAFLRRPTTRSGRRKRRRRKPFLTEIGASKLLVAVWGVVLCGMASACILIADQYDNAVDLALALVGYTYGPLLGIFLLAFLTTRRDDAGLVWAVPMAMLAIFGLLVHDVHLRLDGAASWVSRIDVSDWVVWLGVATILTLTLLKPQANPERVAAIAAGALVIVLLHQYQVGTDVDGRPTYPAFTWSYPIGTVMTFALAYCLGNRLASDD